MIFICWEVPFCSYGGHNSNIFFSIEILMLGHTFQYDTNHRTNIFMSLCLLVNSINICLLFVQKYALNEAKVNEITFIIRFSDILLKNVCKNVLFSSAPSGMWILCWGSTNTIQTQMHFICKDRAHYRHSTCLLICQKTMKLPHWLYRYYFM